MKTSETLLGKGTDFIRIRRVTGYLSEDKQFNNGKKAELRDRVKHFKVNSDNTATMYSDNKLDVRG